MTGELIKHSLNRRAVSWRRARDKSWHLVVSGKTAARLIRIPEGWLSIIWHEEDHGWHAVDFATLAHGKACLAAWWAKRDTYQGFERYMAPERFRTERDDDIAPL